MADLPDATRTIACEMCGAAPASAVVDTPLTPQMVAEIDRTFAALNMPRILTSTELMAVCSTCLTITDAALRGALSPVEGRC